VFSFPDCRPLIHAFFNIQSRDRNLPLSRQPHRQPRRQPRRQPPRTRHGAGTFQELPSVSRRTTRKYPRHHQVLSINGAVSGKGDLAPGGLNRKRTVLHIAIHCVACAGSASHDVTGLHSIPPPICNHPRFSTGHSVVTDFPGFGAFSSVDGRSCGGLISRRSSLLSITHGHRRGHSTRRVLALSGEGRLPDRTNHPRSMQHLLGSKGSHCLPEKDKRLAQTEFQQSSNRVSATHILHRAHRSQNEVFIRRTSHASLIFARGP
jgi:hypothetical protein